jgi:hypothetical protein
MKNIAVLAYDAEAFQYGIKSMFAATINKSTRTAVTFPDVTFRFIGNPEHCRGYTFDAVILFEGYQARERWRETFENLRYCMRG